VKQALAERRSLFDVAKDAKIMPRRICGGFCDRSDDERWLQD